MRLKVTFTLTNPNSSLPLNYSYYLASLIYRAMERADSKLSLEMHKPNVPKLFTFSRLFVPGKKFRIEGERMVLDASEVYFYFSSPRNELVEKFVAGLLVKPEIRMAGCDFTVSEVKVEKERKIGSKEKFITMSPIHVSTAEENGGKRRKIDLYPDNPRFYEILRKNLVKKYMMLHRTPPESEELEVKPLNVKAKKVRIKDTDNRCVEMVFVAKGNPELLDIGYKAGFGSKNSMGFGMVKVV